MSAATLADRSPSRTTRNRPHRPFCSGCWRSCHLACPLIPVAEDGQGGTDVDGYGELAVVALLDGALETKIRGTADRRTRSARPCTPADKSAADTFGNTFWRIELTRQCQARLQGSPHPHTPLVRPRCILHKLSARDGAGRASQSAAILDRYSAAACVRFTCARADGHAVQSVLVSKNLLRDYDQACAEYVTAAGAAHSHSDLHAAAEALRADRTDQCTDTPRRGGSEPQFRQAQDRPRCSRRLVKERGGSIEIS